MGFSSAECVLSSLPILPLCWVVGKSEVFVWSRCMQVVGGRAWARALVGVARTVWADGMGAGLGMRRSAWENVE